MFNSEQRDYMRYLAKQDPNTLCFCGWYHKGDCPHCPPDKSAADKIALKCPECGGNPITPDGNECYHRKECSKRT